MLISYSKKFIFIHVYKTAGISIRKTLSKYQLVPGLELPNRAINYALYNIRNYHASADELRKRLPKRIFDNYYKFAFVRNPWDWQVSLFNYMQQTSHHHQNSLARQFDDFDSYLEWRVLNEVRLQSSFLFDEAGKQLVDYIGKLETIDSDIATISSRLDLKYTSLPKVNATKRSVYQNYYTPKTRDLVYKYFKKDIDLFGYSF